MNPIESSTARAKTTQPEEFDLVILGGGTGAGLPYTALRDAVLTHPTPVEGLIPLFSSAPSADNGAETSGSEISAA
jgi:hypothetical protein